MYEIIGRRWTIFLSFIFTGIVVTIMPYSAPDMDLLLWARIVLGITMAAPMAHPLIPDYVRNNSKGKAMAVNGLGYVFGEIFALGILFNWTKEFNFYDAFAIAGGLFAVFGIILFFTIKDPDQSRIRGTSSRHSALAESRGRNSRRSHAEQLKG